MEEDCMSGGYRTDDMGSGIAQDAKLYVCEILRSAVHYFAAGMAGM